MNSIHNPTHFEPSDYTVEDYLDNKRPQYYGGPAELYEQVVKQWEGDMERALGKDWRMKSHHCIHCGNGRVRWITAVRHLPTNEVVVFGSDCTERLGFANKVAFKLALLQSRDAAHKVRFKIWQQRAAFLTAHPELAALVNHIDEAVHSKNTFAKDVLAKLDQWGSLSDKQVAAVVSSMQRDRDFAARAPVEEIKGDAPSGRCAVSGVVVSMKNQESDFGVVQKMLVKLDNGAKVWCTVPSKLTIERTNRITVTATWSVSNDDKSFAFGSRPVVTSVEEVA